MCSCSCTFIRFSFLIKCLAEVCNFIRKETLTQVFFHDFCETLKNTHRGKAPLNKTPALTKSMSMDIWVVCTSNKLFIR